MTRAATCPSHLQLSKNNYMDCQQDIPRLMGYQRDPATACWPMDGTLGWLDSCSTSLSWPPNRQLVELFQQHREPRHYNGLHNNSLSSHQWLAQEVGCLILVVSPHLMICGDTGPTLSRRHIPSNNEIVDEITQLVEAAAEDTNRWWTGLAEHIQPVYYDQEHDQVTQIPTFLHLLEIAGYPGLQHLRDDLEHGFAVTGELHPGCGWNPRHDDRYNYPIDHATFMKLNRSYALEKLRRAHVDPHWKVMLDELIQERTKGRLSGPFRAPSWWPRSSLALDGVENLDLPTDEVAVAFCFSVTQSDKTMRRSGHNSTVMVRDTPHHDDLDVFIRVAHQYSLEGAETQSWSQDLAGAYRQFPVRNPNDCFVAINTPQGAFLFRHHAMAFGAVASVWGFNRCGDALSFLAQRVLFCLV